MSHKSQKVTGQATMPHHSRELIQMFPMKELVCIAGRTSWTLTFNATLLVLCKRLKLEDQVTTNTKPLHYHDYVVLNKPQSHDI